MDRYPRRDWRDVGTLLILHGRAVCRARSPQCTHAPCLTSAPPPNSTSSCGDSEHCRQVFLTLRKANSCFRRIGNAGKAILSKRFRFLSFLRILVACPVLAGSIARFLTLPRHTLLRLCSRSKSRACGVSWDTIIARLSFAWPTIRDGAIVFDAIRSVEDLPSGWTDLQAPASYKLQKRDDGALFGFAIGPVTWKKFLFPPRVRLLAAQRDGKGFTIVAEQHAENEARPPMAFIGIRSCELFALGLHDRIFMDGEGSDPTFRALRESTFIVAVECLQPGGTCFCASMGTGPAVEKGFDLALTEMTSGGSHTFIVRRVADGVKKC